MNKNTNTLVSVLALLTAGILTAGATATAAVVNNNDTRPPKTSAAKLAPERPALNFTSLRATAEAVSEATFTPAPQTRKPIKPAEGNSEQPTKPAFTCKNKLAQTLNAAGFEGTALRVAWSIVMRESHGKNLDESSPWFTGALGIWQIQTSAHSGKSWWSRSAMLDPEKQSRIAYKYLSANATNFTPWGIGQVKRSTKQANQKSQDVKPAYDFSNYQNWSDWQRQSWIVEPFERNWANFPCS